jgi:hypothetical protein
VLDAVVAIGIGALRTAGASAGQRNAEGLLPTMAMVCVFLAPAAVAVIGLALERPACSCAAGITCFPIALISVAAFPILVAGALYLIGFARASGASSRFSLPDVVIAGGFPIPIVAGLWVLVTRTHPYEYATATGYEGGDAFTRANAALCIALLGGAVLAATLLALLGSPRVRGGRATPVAH